MPPLVERPRGHMEYTFINTSDNDTQHVNDGSYISNNNNNTNYNQQQQHNASQAPLTIATPTNTHDASSHSHGYGHGFGYAYGQFEVITSNNNYSPSPSNHNHAYSFPASSSMLTLSPSTPGANSSFSEFYASPSPMMSPVSPEHVSPSFAFAVPQGQHTAVPTSNSPALSSAQGMIARLSPAPPPPSSSSEPSNPNPPHGPQNANNATKTTIRNATKKHHHKLLTKSP